MTKSDISDSMSSDALTHRVYPKSIVCKQELLPWLLRSDHSFDDTILASQVNLAFLIQDWLVSSHWQLPPPLRMWGRDVFWMSFVAAFPTFPLGAWPNRRSGTQESRLMGNLLINGWLISEVRRSPPCHRQVRWHAVGWRFGKSLGIQCHCSSLIL
ncbi:hypothetical protein BC826DRAFT_1054741 [Russula brevipes]|nr:hypothetical protein BC826DRAFT_1054741 [Russula brevipes]